MFAVEGVIHFTCRLPSVIEQDVPAEKVVSACDVSRTFRRRIKVHHRPADRIDPVVWNPVAGERNTGESAGVGWIRPRGQRVVDHDLASLGVEGLRKIALLLQLRSRVVPLVCSPEEGLVFFDGTTHRSAPQPVEEILLGNTGAIGKEIIRGPL